MTKNFKRGLLPLFIGLGMLLVMLMPVAHLAASGVDNLTDVAPPGGPIVAPASPSGPAVVNGPNGLTYYNDRGTFETAYPGLPLEDFNDTLIGPGAITGCPAPFNSTTSNACFAPGTIIPGVNFQDNPLNGAGGGSANGLAVLGTGALGNASPTVVANTFVDMFEVTFNAPEPNAVGMDLVDYLSAQTLNITIYDTNDVQIGATTGLATNNEGSFFGVYSAAPIGRITLLAPNSTGDGAEGVDNFSFGVAATSAPSITITKSPATQDVVMGGNASFTITVTNTGDVDLDNVTVSDAMVSACDNAVGTLAVSATVSYGCVDAGVTMSYTNVAMVTSTLATGGPGPTATASADVNVVAPTSVSLTGFGEDAATFSPALFVAILALVVGVGYAIRRKVTD